MTLAYLELCSHHLNLILEPYKETLKKKKQNRNPLHFSYHPPVSPLPPTPRQSLIYFLPLVILVLKIINYAAVLNRVIDNGIKDACFFITLFLYTLLNSVASRISIVSFKIK